MKRWLFLFYLLGTQFLSAQTVLETNPPSLRWYQVNTPHFKVLFPKGFDQQAQRMANTLEHIHEPEARSLGSTPRKIAVILQNQSSISNGFVSVFPRRSEFYAMPTQDYNFGGTNDWLDMLAAHEYRHIVQYQHATRGFNRLLFYVFGYPTLAGLAHAAAPDWFWEGDAVATETAFTSSGRGRIPNFGLLFRTNLLEGRVFNYHKQYLRSYKHQIPNHYVLGYHMVSYLRRRTDDPEIWGKITARAWNMPFIPFAFSNAIKNKAGLYVTDLYNEMAQSLQQEWQDQLDSLTFTPFETVHERSSEAYTNYLYPQPQADGSVLVLKEGIGDIQQFVILKDGKEDHVFTPGFLNESGMLSAAQGIVVWNEYGYDPRWQVRNYSRIKAFDLKRSEKIVVPDKHSRYASAALSPDATNVLTVRTDQQYQHRLLLLSFPDGTIERTFANEENYFYSMPRWSSDGKTIAVLKTTPEGRTITVIDPVSGAARDILPVSNENIGYPVLFNDLLFFNSPISGIDNIYVVDRATGKRYQVTSSKYGAYNPAISHDGNFIYYNEQGRNGMDVVRVPLNITAWKEYKVRRPARSFYQHLVDQEGMPGLFDNVPTRTYPVTKYSKAAHIINPFSWGTFVENDLASIDFGITSRNILSTTNISAGYRFDLNERTGLWRAGLSYQGLYPIIDLEFTQGNRSVNEGNAETIVIRGQDTTRVFQDVVFKWDEQNISAGLRVPLITTNSKYSSNVTIGNRVGFTKVRNFRNAYTQDRFYPYLIRNDTVFLPVYSFLDYVSNGNLLYNHLSGSAFRLLKRSHRDINSKWGQAIFLNYYNTPYGGDFEGQLFSAVGYFYFPGIVKHHSLNGYVAYQDTRIGKSFDEYRNDYFFRNTVPVPRGTSVLRFAKFTASSINYTLPLWYPDIALGPILNIQRVRLNLFSDYAYGEYGYFNGVNRSYHSVGGELTFDFNVMRFLPQFNLGVRYSYGLSPSFTDVELVIGTFNF